MALLGIFWPNIAQRDIHLVPGTVSPRIDQLLGLNIEDSTEEQFASNPPASVKVTFTPRFFGAPAAHGVTVNTSTGQVKVGALPAPRYLSFRSRPAWR